MIEKNKLKLICISVIILSCNFINSQESLLDEIDYNNEDYKLAYPLLRQTKL